MTARVDRAPARDRDPAPPRTPRLAPIVVPVQSGCCPDHPRCLLCPPPPPAPSAELVEALVEHYRDGDRPLRVGFYGGAPPTDPQLDAIGGLPFVARVRPDLLGRADLARLVAAGAVGIELDAATFHDPALKAIGRRYRAARVLEQLDGIAAAGIAPGIVLAPGLPGTSHLDAVEDARIAAARVRFVRIHPVLVLDGSGLQRAHLDGTYVPLGLGEAVSTCRAMLDLLHEAGVDVIRVGQNPGPDGLGRAVAGPRHPSLRQLCDARRTLAVLHRSLEGTVRGARLVVRCHPADETSARGPFNQHVRTLRATYGLAALRVRPDPSLARGQFVIDDEGAP
ncbi:MAG: hypothetical protein ABMB14_35185 [Myxococcota bacterium]